MGLVTMGYTPTHDLGAKHKSYSVAQRPFALFDPFACPAHPKLVIEWGVHVTEFCYPYFGHIYSWPVHPVPQQKFTR